MKARPTLFISGVSHEFGSFRDAVENEIEMKGCFAENQPGFPPDWRTVEEMLRRKLHDSDAVIHIVGFRFGAERNERPASMVRRSYTQMEFDIAREMQKPVFIFLSADASVRDPAKSDEKPEDVEATALQQAHREAVQKTNHLYYFFKNKAELCKLVAEIPIVATAEFRVDVSRILKYAPEHLIGRDDELKLLDEAWLKVRHCESHRPRVLTFVALGGEGKTSLVAKWIASLSDNNWPGCDAVFAWSFYSQGTRDQVAASSDLFLKEALTFFGDDTDKAFAASPAGAFEKGQRLARLVGQRRSLLILDGLEPLQYAPTAPTPGELKDQGISALLKGLAAASHGLCVVTTRYPLPDLRAFRQTTAPEKELKRLSKEGGVALLRSFKTGSEENPVKLRGTQAEFEQLVEDLKGHALSITLMGSFLVQIHRGDIRKRDLVKLERADRDHHAFHILDAYVRSLAPSGFRAWLRRLFNPKERETQLRGKRAVALLRLMGLFDRPADAGCLAALLPAPAIPGLTDPLVGLSEEDWNTSLASLESAKLLTVSPETVSLPTSAFPLPTSLDAHPLLREYFAGQLREKNPDAWRAAHRRLYEHLCATTQEGDQPTLEALQPLYQAVAHGCQAGLQQEACDEVFRDRIRRGGEDYATKRLAAFGSELGAVACFFEPPWIRVSPSLTEPARAWLLIVAAYCLRALGRLTEALEPMRAGLKNLVTQTNWKSAAASASNLSELELTLGEVAGALGDAEQSVTYADRSGDAFHPYSKRCTLGEALHQAGRRAEAETRFREAEQMQKESQPDYPLLYSLPGFRYCDLLLAAAERAAWERMKDEGGRMKEEQPSPASSLILQPSSLLASCRAVSQRAAQTLEWAEMGGQGSLLDIALDHLTLGRAALYAAILTRSDGILPSVADERRQDAVAPWETARCELDAAVSGLRRAGQMDDLPRGLFTRAWLRFLDDQPTGPDSAQADLDEAWDIAERGPMKLHMADILLTRCRLFGVVSGDKEQSILGAEEKAAYPWNMHPDGSPRGPKDDLAAAEKLIQLCGYHRRDEELADAKQALGW